MEPVPKHSWKWSRKVSTTFALWTLSSLAVAIFAFALGMSRGEFIPWSSLATGVIGGTLAVPLLLLVRATGRWLRSWKNIKRLSVWFIYFLLLLLLVRFEENWRGRHAWEKFRREWEAKGEQLDFKAFIPPPVPDNQNFAMAPIVASCYSHLLDSNGHRVKPARTNIVDRLDFNIYGRDYFDRDSPTNGDWRKATLTDLKGWQHYYRNSFHTNEAGVVRREFVAPAEPQSPGHDVLLALSRYDEPLKELNEASGLPQSRFPLEYGNENPGAIILPHLAALKKSAQALQLRALAELESGDGTNACRDTLLIFQLSEKIRSEPFFITHLVRIALIEIAIQVIYEGLTTHRWQDAELIELSNALSGQNLAADYRFAMRGETVFQISMCDFFRKHPAELLALAKSGGCFFVEASDLSAAERAASHLIPPGWIYQNQINSTKMMIETVYPIADETNQTFSVEKGEAHIGSFQHYSPFDIFHFIRQLVTPALGSAAKKFALCQTSVNLASVGIALERQRLATGSYPEKLDALSPQFILHLPPDTIGGQPLKYRREADGLFVLYSVAWNQTDDGGVTVFWESSAYTLDETKGDWVWRYPAK